MSAEHSNDSDPIEELLLTAYPNPKRSGCPGASVLQALGNLQLNEKDPHWYHVWHCSPCFAEFKQIRDARWKRERASFRRRKLLLWSAAAAVLLTGSLAVFKRTHASHFVNLSEIAQVTIDLSDTEIRRGTKQDRQLTLPPLPRKLDDVRIVLPLFSEEGRYSVAVLRSKDSDSALALSSARTTANEHRLELRVRLDLSRAAPGNYLLGTRFNHGELVYYYPLKVN